ncbi:hypothetical protein VZ957_004510 [Salmonella enterica]|nr:hypothetical protein [Salmonella enterica]
MRDINDSLAPEIEAQIAEREREEGDISRLMAVLDGKSAAVASSVTAPAPVTPAETVSQAIAATVTTAAVVTGVAAAAASADSNPVEEPELYREDDGIVDMDTGEVLYPGDTGYEEQNEKFNRAFGEAVDTLREDERNMVFHARDERERGGGDEPERGDW